MKVLIAEDHGPSRRLLFALLREQGHEVKFVSDWLMPGMDGTELCRRVRGSGLLKGKTRGG